MAVRRKFKLKPNAIILLKRVGIVLGILLAIFLFYRHNINELKKLGYSEKASNTILFKFKKSYVMDIGKNKTLNAAFESKDYKEKNIDNYSKIKYQNHKHLIKHINLLLKKGYHNKDISLILAHGTDNDVEEFIKHKKIRYIEEFFTIDCAKINNYDRYIAYSDETGEDEETVVVSVNLDMDKEPYKEPLKIRKYNKYVLVTKHRQLMKSYKPKLVNIDKKYALDSKQKSVKEAKDAFIKMYKAAKKKGYEIYINSSYRSYEEQEKICNTYSSLYGQSYIEKYVAKPGYSEHQTGLVFDIASKKNKIFAESKEYKWMQENAYKYGFIQRYPKGYEEITGFRAEQWHYRYVGKKIAKYIYDHKITYDEYYIRFLDK
ncbi:MAG: M15 family metallopeptidase [Bacilli bacterium]|nr:M15 family metallopeptidase [Bacilli bacterium]